MRCINDRLKKRMLPLFLSLCMLMLAGCGSADYSFAYNVDSEISSFQVFSFLDGRKVSPYAENLCVVKENVLANDLKLDNVSAGFLFDINNKNVLIARNMYAQLAPASLTKIMTAIVALKYGKLDQVLTATNVVNIKEYGATLAGIRAGDKLTLDQALRVLLIYSANDVANLIAENIGGSVENFVAMMNEEAKHLGATSTHFVNAHGLDDPEHYTTAYDLYLMFNEAIKYADFTEIVHMSSYQTSYYDKNGKLKNLNVSSSNRYLRGSANPPDNVTIIGGKTGTTSNAGYCLIMLVKDKNGASYVSGILNAESSDALYQTMTELLMQMNK